MGKSGQTGRTGEPASLGIAVQRRCFGIGATLSDFALNLFEFCKVCSEFSRKWKISHENLEQQPKWDFWEFFGIYDVTGNVRNPRKIRFFEENGTFLTAVRKFSRI